MYFVSFRYLFYFNDNVFSSVIDSSLGKINSIKICVSKCPNKIDNVGEMTNFTMETHSNLCVYDVMTPFNGTGDGLAKCPKLPIQEQ